MIRELQDSATIPKQGNGSNVRVLCDPIPRLLIISKTAANLIANSPIKGSRVFHGSVGNYAEGNVTGGQHYRNTGTINYGSIGTQNFEIRREGDVESGSGAEKEGVGLVVRSALPKQSNT